MPSLSKSPPRQNETHNDYVESLLQHMKEAGDKLRSQQFNIRQEETEEPNLYMQGDLVWLKTYMKKKGENPKLAPKYVGPYEIVEVLPYHTYRVRKDNKESIQHEGRIRLHVERTTDGPQTANHQHLTEDTKEDEASYSALTDIIQQRTTWQIKHADDKEQGESSSAVIVRQKKVNKTKSAELKEPVVNATQQHSVDTTVDETVSLETNITSKESTSTHTPTPNQTTTRKEQIINQGQLNEDTAVTEEEDTIQREIDCKQQSLGSSSSIHQDQQGGDDDSRSQ